jgi:hypothetical protein
MPPRAPGTVVIDRRHPDDPAFALRIREHGRRRYVRLGRASEGWTEERAHAELATRIRQQGSQRGPGWVYFLAALNEGGDIWRIKVGWGKDILKRPRDIRNMSPVDIYYLGGFRGYRCPHETDTLAQARRIAPTVPGRTEWFEATDALIALAEDLGEEGRVEHRRLRPDA